MRKSLRNIGLVGAGLLGLVAGQCYFSGSPSHSQASAIATSSNLTTDGDSTYLKGKYVNFTVEGTDVVELDQNTHRYVLNFPQDRAYSITSKDGITSLPRTPEGYKATRSAFADEVSRLNEELEGNRK
jgi:hypothetical protein